VRYETIKGQHNNFPTLTGSYKIALDVYNSYLMFYLDPQASVTGFNISGRLCDGGHAGLKNCDYIIG